MRYLFRAFVAIMSVAASFAIGTSQGNACLAFSFFNPDVVDDAAAVIEGEVTSYKKLNGSYALIEFSTLKTFKGEQRKTWKLVWANSTFGVPSSESEFLKTYKTTKLIVAFGSAGTIGRSRAASFTIMPSDSAEVAKFPWITQSPCSNPFMSAADDPTLLEALRSRGLTK